MEGILNDPALTEKDKYIALWNYGVNLGFFVPGQLDKVADSGQDKPNT